MTPIDRRSVLGLLLWTSVGAVTPALAEDSPEPVVRDFYATLLEAMKRSNELGFAGREKLLAPVIERTFDLDYMARVGVGPLWGKFDPQLQKRFSADFANWTIATYASEFHSYNGERFDVLGTIDAPNNNKIVKTTLTPSDGKPVVLNYLMHLTDAGWRIIDVYLTGTISELATRRSEFTAIIRSEGPEGLTKSLEKRVDELKAKSK